MGAGGGCCDKQACVRLLVLGRGVGNLDAQRLGQAEALRTSARQVLLDLAY